ncbi:glycoside hydrolase family 28 protein [Silvimonas soli]|uniref:glycoside hydrolase family 28 protein n=1 Tax=Silvimonas soli TaxID=2980100 RepID=UPI0024B36E9B|nr:glycosyl hydrolase family 28 protein [Silvimonas soli]
MKMHKTREMLQRLKELGFLVPVVAVSIALSACGGGGGDSSNATNYSSDKPFQVGTTSFDANLPAEPSLPTDDQVCATVYAQPNVIGGKSVPVVSRPDGSLPPEADPSTSGNGVATTTANPDQARIQAALDQCGASVDAEVGGQIAAVDAAATASQKLANVMVTVKNASAPVAANIAGVSGEELAKPQYKAKKFAVRLVASQGADGSNGFISGPLTLPSGVTLWIDKGVTLYASRDATTYLTTTAGKYCANTANSGSAGSSSNCQALINGNNMVNSAVMGDGRIDSRGYAEVVTSNKYYPLMKVDLTCTNTYAAYLTNKFAADGTPCDNGGTFVDTKSAARNMTWWDLAFKGNMVDNGTTGSGSQSNFRMMVFNYAKNLTLYRITLNNSANFHVVPSGVDGLTIWGVKVQTPSLAAFANPAGNGNPLYNGQTFTEDNVKNTDAFDPGAASKQTSVALATGSKTNSAAKISFDGYLKNFVFAYNFVSTGDDDIALKGSSNPTPGGNGSGIFAIDGNRDVRSDRKWGMIIAHNHIYWGHGISVGSETNSGVTNVQVYDNSFQDSEEGLRIKSDYARGGEVSNINYSNICIKDAQNALLFTPYYSTKALPAAGPLYPNFHDIVLNNVRILGSSNVKLQGFQANTGGFGNPAYPLVMSLTNVLADSGTAVTVSAMSDANLTVRGVNLPLFSSTDNRVVVNGTVTQAVDPSKVIDCSNAFVDFPAIGQSNLFGSTWASH